MRTSKNGTGARSGCYLRKDHIPAMKEIRAMNGSSIGVGIAIGLAIGTAMGTLTGNLALWIGIGLAMGVGIGAAMAGTSNRPPE